VSLSQAGQLKSDFGRNPRGLSKKHVVLWRTGLIFAACLLLITGYNLINQQQKTERIQDELLTQEIIQQGNLATLKISKQFNIIKNTSKEIAEQLTQNKLSDKQIREMIKQKVMTTEGAFRGGVVFKRDRFNNTSPLYSPYFQKGAINTRHQQLSDRYDYTQADTKEPNKPRTFWFHQPLKQGAMWLQPYYGTSANSWISEYIRPFSAQYDGNNDNGYDGIIFLNLSLKGLSRIVSQLELAQSGFGFILTAEDKLISYPVEARLGQGIKQIQEQDTFFKTIIEQRDKGPITAFVHPINKKECWLFFSKISGTNDTLGILVWADELRAKQNLNKTILSLENFAWLLILMAFILLLACLRFPKTIINLGYRFSILISIIILISLISLWGDKLNGELSLFSEHQVFEEVNVNNLLLKNTYLIPSNTSLDKKKQTEITVHIKALNLLDPGTIQVIGNISLDNLTGSPELPPIFFPLANNSEWEKLDDNGTTQTWKFTSDIRQPFDYASFPFDMEEIKIQIQGKKQLTEQILVPRFLAYSDMSPASLPGIDQNSLELSGWQSKQSYFSYQLIKDKKHAILEFNLVVKRDITGPIITHFLPLIMVSCLAFCTLLLWTKNEKKITLWGFSSATILEQCAALFFILVISHVSLRDELEAKGMIFLEYFYFATYAQIVFVAVAAIVYTSDIQFRILDFKEGLIIKMLYWPICFIFCLFITLVQFV